jgi:formate hydrogenlyase subunit 4
MGRVPVIGAAVASVIAYLVMPFLLIGVINRVKSLWSGRKGPPLLQPAYDVLRLLRKGTVYSTTTTPLFRVAPWVYLVTTAGSALLTPLLGSASVVSFQFDFVWFAYVWALGRVSLMLAALDTGSAFEGMGTSREAAFSTLVEPVLFLTTGALCLASGAHSFSQALVLPWTAGTATLVVRLGAVAALFVVLQVETGRMPIDDPTTHLELTMVHEVMVLDHSGPDLAAIQWASALKLTIATSILAMLLNPWAGSNKPIASVANLGLCGLIAVAIGTIESLIARLRLRTIPKYIAVALASAAVALLATAWRTGSAP